MPHDSFPPTPRNSQKYLAKPSSPSSDLREDMAFREFFRDLLVKGRQPPGLEPRAGRPILACS
jgi:hypothetical protein